MFSSFGGGGSFSPFSNMNINMQPQTFDQMFRCYPVSMMPSTVRKDDANFGGKIFLPPSALNKLTMLHIRYPMLFELTNDEQSLKTCSGVLEFVAEEGRAYLPQWMMNTLKAKPGALMRIASVDVPLGKFVKIEPQSVDFLDISDPKAVLENVLRKFSTLTVNDVIEVDYNDKIYGIKVLEVKPESAHSSICVVETDLETDFAPPVGYVEPDYSKMKKSAPVERPLPSTSGTMAKSIGFEDKVHSANREQSSFHGDGQRLSGRPMKNITNEVNNKPLDLTKIVFEGEPAPLILPDGQLFFGFPLVPVADQDENGESTESSSQHFTGQGQSLRKTKKRKDLKSHESPKPKVHSPEVIEID